MREIKFRAWDKDIQNFIPTMEIIEIIKKSNYRQFGKEVVTNNDGVKNLTIVLNSNMDAMLYTGLKDKNGKEIYEGDIVDFTYVCGITNSTQRGVIGFKNGSFTIQDGGIVYYNLLDYELEVIGNVYENIDLLEDEE